MHKDSVFISQRIQCSFIRNTNQFMLYREHIDVCYENYTTLTHTLCGQKVEAFRRSLRRKREGLYGEHARLSVA
jgi:hypothetical protein